MSEGNNHRQENLSKNHRKTFFMAGNYEEAHQERTAKEKHETKQTNGKPRARPRV